MKNKIRNFGTLLGIFTATAVITYAASSLIPTYAPGTNPSDLDTAPLIYRMAGQTDPDNFDHANDSLKGISEKLDVIQGLAGNSGGGGSTGMVGSYGGDSGKDIDVVECSMYAGYNQNYYYWIDHVDKKVYVKGYNANYLLGMGHNTNVSNKTENTAFDGLDVESITCSGSGMHSVATIRQADGSLKYYTWGILYYGGLNSPFFSAPGSLPLGTGSGSVGYGVPTEFDPSRTDNETNVNPATL